MTDKVKSAVTDAIIDGVDEESSDAGSKAEKPTESSDSPKKFLSDSGVCESAADTSNGNVAPAECTSQANSLASLTEENLHHASATNTDMKNMTQQPWSHAVKPVEVRDIFLI